MLEKGRQVGTRVDVTANEDRLVLEEMEAKNKAQVTRPPLRMTPSNWPAGLRQQISLSFNQPTPIPKDLRGAGIMLDMGATSVTKERQNSLTSWSSHYNISDHPSESENKKLKLEHSLSQPKKKYKYPLDHTLQFPFCRNYSYRNGDVPILYTSTGDQRTPVNLIHSGTSSNNWQQQLFDQDSKSIPQINPFSYSHLPSVKLLL